MVFCEYVKNKKSVTVEYNPVDNIYIVVKSKGKKSEFDPSAYRNEIENLKNKGYVKKGVF